MRNSPAYGIWARLAGYAKVSRTIALRLLRRTDAKKWREYSFPSEWDLRTRQIAAFVPSDSTVYEFGAGASKLAEHLPATCTLISSDVIERRPGMLVFDLNRRPLPSITGKRPRVAVFGGVLEYLGNLQEVVQWTGNNFDLCIASYECADRQPGLLTWVRHRIRRSHQGWINHYTQTQLTTLFESAGLPLVQAAVWGESDPGFIFAFERRKKTLA